MDEAQRYRWFAPSEAVGEEPARDGEWVRYTDHARRVGELEFEVLSLRTGMEQERLSFAVRLRELTERLTAAEADAGRLRADAMRYRWLRENVEHGFGGGAQVQMFTPGAPKGVLWLHELDAAIDAALAAGVGGGES